MVDPFNNFLFQIGGPTGKALKYTLDEHRSVGSAFFKPYKSASNFTLRAVSVVTAPIGLTILAIELLGIVIFTAIQALMEVCRQAPATAIDTIKTAGPALLMFFPALLAAIISPIVNLIDLIGGGVVSIAECCEKDEAVSLSM